MSPPEKPIAPGALMTTAEHGLIDAGPLGALPRLNRRQVQLVSRLARAAADPGWHSALGWLGEATGAELRYEHGEVLWRASGLRRTGVVAQISWPRLSTRIGLGLETPLAHGLVDHLLGFDRLPAEGRLQVTPVEWGILSFVVAEILTRLSDHPGPLGPWDLVLDRLGPDPFDPQGLGSVVTLRWPVRIGSMVSSVRLWLPENLVALWLASVPEPTREPKPDREALRGRFAKLASTWHAEAGTVTMTKGPSRLRVGGVLPIDESRLKGTRESPAGPIDLALRDFESRYWFPAEAVPGSGGSRLTLTAPLHREPTTREAFSMHLTPPIPAPPDVAPSDVPVTLVIELGRVNLPLAKLADLKPGDVLELARHSKSPVELTSGGRLVARGELVQIDVELGVRVTHVFL